MTKEEFNKIWDRLSISDKNIPCIISTSRLAGDGMIIDADASAETFTIEIDGNTHEVSRFGVMEK